MAPPHGGNRISRRNERETEEGMASLARQRTARIYDGKRHRDFGNLVENIGNIFVQSIADAFERLPRSFKSHDGFKIGARCILDAAVDPRYNGRFSWRSYSHSNARDTLDDLDRAFHRLAKLEWKTHAGDIADKAMSEGESDCETTFFRLRFFANGNVHVWMKNADIVKEANKLLAEHYGPKLGHMHKPPHQRP